MLSNVENLFLNFPFWNDLSDSYQSSLNEECKCGTLGVKYLFNLQHFRDRFHVFKISLQTGTISLNFPSKFII